jgi:opacity protein-like surface antigen
MNRMMRGLSALVAAWLAGVAFAATAQAADMSRSWPSQPDFQRPPTPVMEMVSGWYLRGDIGYRINKMGSISGSITPVTDHRYDNSFMLGGGVGYKYQWFRTDLTFDYGKQGRARGFDAAGTLNYDAKIDTFTTLANLYFDLGTWGGITPYVGAGIGASYLRTSDYINTSLPSTIFSVTPKWSLSWALMSGLSFQVMPSIVFDVGYRYLKLGDAEASDRPASAARTSFKNISAQEVRLGIRYLFD